MNTIRGLVLVALALLPIRCRAQSSEPSTRPTLLNRIGLGLGLPIGYPPSEPDDIATTRPARPSRPSR